MQIFNFNLKKKRKNLNRNSENLKKTQNIAHLAAVEKLMYQQKENAIKCNGNTFCKLIMTY